MNFTFLIMSNLHLHFHNQLTFIGKNSNRFVESFDAIYYFLGNICVSIQAFTFIFNNRKIDKIKSYLDENVKKRGQIDCYRIYEDIAMKISNVISLLLSITVFLSGSSLIRTLYRVFVMKNDLHDNYLLPIVCSLPFEVTNWTRYSIAFIWNFASVYTLGVSKMITSSVQLTFCFYTIAIMTNHQGLASEFGNVK